MSYVNIGSFTSSFPIWITFISFAYLIALTRPSQKLLNESGETRNPCLVPDVRKKKHQFLAMKYVSFRFVIYGLYYVEVHSHCTHFVESFVFFLIH